MQPIINPMFYCDNTRAMNCFSGFIISMAFLMKTRLY